ncbi:MAG: chromosome segregation protein SMC [Butyribacter sp.]|nr:chromosome segregation protein SMC [bacterium]MDY3855340.1 chromosome segregation protein SMC [Butyribacter sp.]
MYLKSLEVQGFKSFANKLVFEFHNGITAIVGPNGSGKSNVADAVRWVLGEQSAKQLRGAKMEDVIFAGTQMRKPLGYAYVAITISNEDHKLAVPYEEVKIARRVYRSGESEYLLNGASCRLKDIQELLFDTGIGKEGYSIIGQGQIDKILSGKPEERRELFDEAAGIVKYKKRKAAAQKNLEEEQQNMVRIEDILSELEKQVGPLKEQSEKAKEYLAYRDELRNLDINLFLSEYDRIHGEITDVEKKEEIASRDLTEATAEFDKTKEEYLEVEGQLEKHNQSLEQKKELLSIDKISLSKSEAEIKVLQEQINAVRQNKEHNREQITSLEMRIATQESEKESYQEQKTKTDAVISDLEQQQAVKQSKIDEMTAEISSLEEKISRCNQDMLVSLNENTDVKTDEQRIKTLLEQNNIKKAELTKKVLENKTEASILAETLEEQKSVLEDVSEKIKAMDDNIAALRQSLQTNETENENLHHEHRDTQQQFHMENSRLESLKNISERYEGFGQSIKRVMEQKKKYPGIIGVVADIIRVQKDYELAVETALGGSIQNIVTDNEQTAKALIAHLKANKYGRATFLPLTTVKAKPVSLSGNILSEPGVIGMASSLVSVEDRFSELIEYLLGRFVVVDHIDHAIALAKKYHHTMRIVTKEGDLINPGGSMSGGAFRNNHNLLGRRREIEELEKRTATLKMQLQTLSQDIAQKEKEAEEISKKLAGNQKVRQELGLQQNTAKLNYEHAVEELDKNNEKLDLIRLESEEIERKKQSLHQDIEKITERMQENEKLNQEREKQIADWNDQLEKAKEMQEECTSQNSSLLLDLTAQKQNRQNIEANMERIGQTVQALQNELQQVNQSGQSADMQVLQKEQEIRQTQDNIADMKRHMEELESSIEQTVAQRNEMTQLHKGFFEKREELSAKKSELDKECFRLSNQKEKLSEKINSYTEYMWEQYELTYHTAEEKRVAIDISPAKMKTEIAKLKNQMKALGDVNVNAVEQYKEVQERYELLHTQHDDLVEAANVLIGIIEELDTEMRKQFETQFAEIRTRFDQVFKELFGGGRGTLELTPDEDILQAGIRIIAQPPGKKLQNMMQLSGGEKALTAIALLFAIQSLKPSPFCLLDEIEAALDDSNVGRYAEYLHKLTKDTQFIVITHRRGTMNAADILYGITMQEKGVSTLVSVNLLDEDEIAN